MKHAKKESPKKRIRRKRVKQLKVLLVLLIIALAGAGITIYRDYQARPGFLEKVWIADRGADYITIAWEKPRNVYKYVITYNGKTIEVGGRNNEAKITELTEDTAYEFSVRADSREREGFEALTASARTKKTQQIEGDTYFMKFANRPVDLKQSAQTALSYSTANGSMEPMGDKVTFTTPGKHTVTVKAEETEEYAAATREITVEVLDSVNVKAKGAQPHILYKLNKKNCKCVMSLQGATSKIRYPQSFAYDKGSYMISFINLDSTDQRIVTYSGKKKSFKPQVDLGHANGLTIAAGYLYSVRGGGLTTCITFDPKNKDYGLLELPYYASGIAYDEKTNMFFTSSRRDLIAYDSDFNLVNRIGLIKRNTTYYVQDCGAYGGIAMHCVSGKPAQGTNYIDFYDVVNGTYLGSAECQLNEIESLIVDDEGYIEVLSNTKEKNDYIWKTPINMKMLCEE